MPNQRSLILWILLIVGISFAIYGWTTPYMGLASFAYFLMLGGMYFRKQVRFHFPLMLLATLMDIGLVLVLEVQRSAIGTAIALGLTPIQQLHIYTSTLALILYFPIIYLGFQNLRTIRSPSRHRKWHIRLGVIAFVLRTLGFMLMFSLLDFVQAY